MIRFDFRKLTLGDIQNRIRKTKGQMVGKVKLEVKEQLGDYLNSPRQIWLQHELKQPYWEEKTLKKKKKNWKKEIDVILSSIGFREAHLQMSTALIC